MNEWMNEWKREWRRVWCLMCAQTWWMRAAARGTWWGRAGRSARSPRGRGWPSTAPHTPSCVCCRARSPHASSTCAQRGLGRKPTPPSVGSPLRSESCVRPSSFPSPTPSCSSASASPPRKGCSSTAPRGRGRRCSHARWRRRSSAGGGVRGLCASLFACSFVCVLCVFVCLILILLFPFYSFSICFYLEFILFLKYPTIGHFFKKNIVHNIAFWKSLQVLLSSNTSEMAQESLEKCLVWIILLCRIE